MSSKKRINENRISYDEKHKERMNQTLERELRSREHSLGPHPAFPECDEQHFEERIASKRFTDILKNYKKQFDVSTFEGPEVLMNTGKYLRNCMGMEQEHKAELEQIAIDLVRKEFDIPEEDLIINAELTTHIDGSSFKENFRPRTVEGLEFENHGEIVAANKEVIKRRFVNAMIQGSAKKCSHLFHLVEEEISNLNPRLNTNYSKMMAGADLSYYLVNDSIMQIPGGIVEVEFPKNEGEPPTINASAVSFPILVHEIVKGAMEILSSHGLPEDSKIAEYVIAKADFTGAENWDMRLGPGIWECFTDAIDIDDFDLKHHIYSDLISLPVDTFNEVMREVLAGTKAGKNYIKDLANDIREELRKDEFHSALITDSFDDDDYFTPDELDDIDPQLL
jgi:hypothetical protein